MQAKAAEVDQKALAAGSEADKAQLSANGATQRVDVLTNTVVNLDNYHPVVETAVHFGFNKDNLTKEGREAIDQLAASVAGTKGYIITVEGGADWVVVVPALPYAAARQGYFFSAIARVNETHRTPGVSILALSAWSAVLVLSGTYRQLFTYVIFASWILYGMTGAAVIILRIKRPDLHRPYRTLGYPAVPILFVLACHPRIYCFHAVGFTSRVADGNCPDTAGTAVLCLLEPAIPTPRAPRCCRR